MKYIMPIFLMIMLNSCKTQNTEAMIAKLSKKATNFKLEECPEEVKCTTEVLRNKDYTIQKDTMGKWNPVIVDGDKIVVKYTYEIINTNKYADGHQSETITFVIDKTTKEELKDGSLQEIKLLFGKNCFCRDIQGYYKVSKGKFTLNKTEIDLEFTISKLGERQYLKKVHLSLD